MNNAQNHQEVVENWKLKDENWANGPSTCVENMSVHTQINLPGSKTLHWRSSE